MEPTTECCVRATRIQTIWKQIKTKSSPDQLKYDCSKRNYVSAYYNLFFINSMFLYSEKT